jgi:hypothetical protein
MGEEVAAGHARGGMPRASLEVAARAIKARTIIRLMVELADLDGRSPIPGILSLAHGSPSRVASQPAAGAAFCRAPVFVWGLSTPAICGSACVKPRSSADRKAVVVERRAGTGGSSIAVGIIMILEFGQAEGAADVRSLHAFCGLGQRPLLREPGNSTVVICVTTFVRGG